MGAERDVRMLGCLTLIFMGKWVGGWSVIEKVGWGWGGGECAGRRGRYTLEKNL